MKRTKLDFIEAFKATYGNISLSCKEAGVSRSTYYKWLESDEEFGTTMDSITIEGKRINKTFLSKLDKYNKARRDKTDLKFKKGRGYVYVVKCEGTNFYKIGISKQDTRNRLTGLQSGCPLELSFYYIGYCDHYGLLEKELHIRYAKHRVRGEWFELSDSMLLCVINDIKEQSNKQLKLF